MYSNASFLIAAATETRTMETTTTYDEVVMAVHVPEYWVRGTKGDSTRLLTLTTDIEKARNVARNNCKHFGYERADVTITRRWRAVKRAA